MTVTLRHEREVAGEVHKHNVEMVIICHGKKDHYDKDYDGTKIGNFLRERANQLSYLPHHRDPELAHRFAEEDRERLEQAKVLQDLVTELDQQGPEHVQKNLIKKLQPWTDLRLRQHAYTWNVWLELLTLGDGSLERACRLTAANLGIPGTTLDDAARKVRNAYLRRFKDNPQWLAEAASSLKSQWPKTIGELCEMRHPDAAEHDLSKVLKHVPQEDVVNPLSDEEWVEFVKLLSKHGMAPWPRGRGGALIKDPTNPRQLQKELEDFRKNPGSWAWVWALAVPWQTLQDLQITEKKQLPD
jgi:hypothetical protein